MIPDGIVIRGDTTVVATADGLQITTDDGAHWTAIGDAIGPPARGPADTALPLLTNEYVRRFAPDRRGWNVTTLRGNQRLWHNRPAGKPSRSPRRPSRRATPSSSAGSSTTALVRAPTAPSTRCRASGRAPRRGRSEGAAHRLAPPADRADGQPFIDQTYRYGSTMGGFFQQHQGVEFNNPDGTPVMAALGGRVVYAGPAEAGATRSPSATTRPSPRTASASGSIRFTTTTPRWP